MAYLVVGTLRYWDEARLLQRAFGLARVPRKRLIMAARVEVSSTRWKRLLRAKWWSAWLRSTGAVRFKNYLPDDELAHLLDAADAVIVVRQNSLGSGIPFLAMTFGRMVIAPDAGAMPEYVSGAANLLYDPVSAESLAKAMEEAAVADREEIGKQNRQIAAGWDWDRLVKTCLAALP